MGLGVYPFASLPGLDAQVFHCPGASNPSVSLNVGIALSTGVETVVVAGSRAYVNDVEIGYGTSSHGSVTIVHSAMATEVHLSNGAVVYSTARSIGSNYLATGYYQDLKLEAPIQATTSSTSSLCTADLNNAMIGISSDDLLFSA